MNDVNGFGGTVIQAVAHRHLRRKHSALRFGSTVTK